MCNGGALDRCPAGCVGLLVRGETVVVVFFNPVTAGLSQCISLNSVFIEETDNVREGRR